MRGADVLRAVDFAAFLAVLALAGLRFVDVVAMLSPLLAQANHLQLEGIMAKQLDQYREFKVGDLVSRDGTDVQRITEINEAGDLITVVCVEEPLGFLEEDGTRGEPWCKVGETETNLARRYQYAGDVIDGATGRPKGASDITFLGLDLGCRPIRQLVRIEVLDEVSEPCGECHIQPGETCDICGRRRRLESDNRP